VLRIIRKLLLKSDRIQNVVADYKLRQKKQRHHLRWELIMSGSTIHMDDSSGPDSTVVVDYIDGRMVSQKHVDPVFIDSTNWGGMK